MKFSQSISLLLIFGLSVVLNACKENPKNTMNIDSMNTNTNQTEAKANIIKKFYEAWDSGEVVAFENILSKKLIDHERSEASDVSDYDNIVNGSVRINAAFSEVKHDLLQTYYVEGNRVIVYWDFTALHTGNFGNLEPTHKPVNMKGVDIFQIKDGKITELWHVENIHKMMAQLRD